jgi:hypothetical protein
LRGIGRLNRSPHRKQDYWNRRSRLLDASILGIVNSVLAIQPNIGEKPLVEPAQTIVLRFLVLPVPAAAQN